MKLLCNAETGFKRKTDGWMDGFIHSFIPAQQVLKTGFARSVPLFRSVVPFRCWKSSSGVEWLFWQGSGGILAEPVQYGTVNSTVKCFFTFDRRIKEGRNE
jgi:hypothetical protein